MDIYDLNNDLKDEFEKILNVTELKLKAVYLKQFKDALIQGGFSPDETHDFIRQTAMALYFNHFNILKNEGENND